MKMYVADSLIMDIIIFCNYRFDSMIVNDHEMRFKI